ncbi:hypothetical protein SLS61_007945 [Didymella pomorum]
MPTSTYTTTVKFPVSDETVKLVATALMISVHFAAIMLGEVVFKKINGHVRKFNELTEHAKTFPIQNDEIRVAFNEQQARLDPIVARLDDVQYRVQELEGPASPESLVPEQELELVPEAVPDDQVVNPYDLRQHSSIFFELPFCKVRTAEEVAEDLK